MDSKSLRVKRILIVFALIGLVFSVLPVKATVTYNVSAIYTDFNASDWVEHDVPGSANYTVPYTVKIDVSTIAWNETTAVTWMTFQLRNASDEASGEIIGIKLLEAGSVLQVLSGTTGTPVIIGATTFTLASEIVIKVSVDGFTVNNGTAIQITYYTPGFSVNGMYVNGVEFSVTAGVANMEFNDGGDFGLDIITDMIPIIVTVAILGAVLKQFGKFKT